MPVRDVEPGPLSGILEDGLPSHVKPIASEMGLQHLHRAHCLFRVMAVKVQEWRKKAPIWNHEKGSHMSVENVFEYRAEMFLKISSGAERICQNCDLRKRKRCLGRIDITIFKRSFFQCYKSYFFKWRNFLSALSYFFSRRFFLAPKSFSNKKSFFSSRQKKVFRQKVSSAKSRLASVDNNTNHWKANLRH